MTEDDEGSLLRVSLVGAAAPDKPASRPLLRAVLFASVVALLLGYDIGVMSGAILDIQSSLDLSTVEQELVIGSLNFVSAFGSLFTAYFSDSVGRRVCLFVAMSLSTVGTMVMTLANGFWMLLAGRFICGLGVGCGMVRGRS